jgi:hypothetical protein
MLGRRGFTPAFDEHRKPDGECSGFRFQEGEIELEKVSFTLTACPFSKEVDIGYGSQFTMHPLKSTDIKPSA